MKTQVRLNSMIVNGIGSSRESAALDFIYEILLAKYNQNYYSYIGINQIDETLDEFIIQKGSQVYMNFRWDSPKDFDTKSYQERRRIMQNCVNEALLKIAHKYGKIDVWVIEKINQDILLKNYDFVYKQFVNKKKQLKVSISVKPMIDYFSIVLNVEGIYSTKCINDIYNGLPSTIYLKDFFSKCRWEKDKIVILGQSKEVEIHVWIETCKVEYIYSNSNQSNTLFQKMRAPTRRSL